MNIATQKICEYGEFHDWARDKNSWKLFREHNHIDRFPQKIEKSLSQTFRFLYSFLIGANQSVREELSKEIMDVALDLANKLDAASIKRKKELEKITMEKDANQPNWRLIAGENSDLVAKGTLEEVENNIVNCGTIACRSPYGGRWVIVAPNGNIYSEGQF